jgi:hypothetical protein
MNTIADDSKFSPSTFALIVDKLKDKSEEELKLLYIKLFSKELADEWSSVTKTSNFENVSEEDIIKAIMKKRYNNKDV